jgi:hypothetical protein
VSLDRKIDQVCPHQVRDEFLFIMDDRQTVSPLRPIASADSVSVRINGLADIPSFGVQVQARVVGTIEGPFTVTASTNRLVVQVNDDLPQTIVLPPLTGVTAHKLAEMLSLNVQGLTFFAERNRVGVGTSLLGQDATFSFLVGSTISTVIGVTVSRIYRGRTPFPGWTLVSDPSTLSDRPRRLVYFDEPFPSDSNFVEISYSTVKEECRRCGGLGVENDWVYGTNGEVVTVSDETLLIQELLKITYTVRGSNPFHSWYGTTIVEKIGTKNAASGVLQNAITSDVYTMFARWQGIKKFQGDKIQFVSDEEFPFRLVSVRLDPSQTDPTVLFLNIEVQNRSSKTFTISRGLVLSDNFTRVG